MLLILSIGSDSAVVLYDQVVCSFDNSSSDYDCAELLENVACSLSDITGYEIQRHEIENTPDDWSWSDILTCPEYMAITSKPQSVCELSFNMDDVFVTQTLLIQDPSYNEESINLLFASDELTTNVNFEKGKQSHVCNSETGKVVAEIIAQSISFDRLSV
jgi:hypothetical protein